MLVTKVQASVAAGGSAPLAEVKNAEPSLQLQPGQKLPLNAAFIALWPFQPYGS
jgi:hypothetical protein